MVNIGGYVVVGEKGIVLEANLPVRNRILKAMMDAKAAWASASFHCPDCIYEDVRREDLLAAYVAALEVVRADPAYGLDGTRWAGGVTTRDVLLDVLPKHVKALKECEDEVLTIEDDFMMCDHTDLVGA